MTADQILSLLAMLTDTITAQQDRIHELATQVQQLTAESG